MPRQVQAGAVERAVTADARHEGGTTPIDRRHAAGGTTDHVISHTAGGTTPHVRPWFGEGLMLGQRQQQIISALEAGPWSYEALVRQLAPERPEDRRAIFGAVQRLQRAGLVRMVGRRGKFGLAGAIVTLADDRPDGA